MRFLILLCCLLLIGAERSYLANVTSVYDADTITADVYLGLDTWRMGEKLRLSRIDAPEVRGSERPEGLIARDSLRAWIMGKGVELVTQDDKKGKYGRIIVEVWLGNENINDKLVSAGLAEYKEY